MRGKRFTKIFHWSTTINVKSQGLALWECQSRTLFKENGVNGLTTLTSHKLLILFNFSFHFIQGYIRDIRHERLKERAKKLQLMSVYFKKWTQRMEAQIETREKQRGEQVRKSIHFCLVLDAVIHYLIKCS